MTHSLLSAKVVILNKDGEVLALRRSDTHPRKPHQIDLPGGLIEKGEFELLGAVREVQEETGILLDANQCALYYADTSKPHHEVVLTMLMYFAKFDTTPSVTISWEHESYEWLPIADLLTCDDLEGPERRSIEFALENDLFTL